MEGRRTIVLLPPIGSLDHDWIADIANKAAIGAEDMVIVPLGFHSEEELSGFNATVRYPEEFFDRRKSDSMDSIALELARSWYNPLSEGVVFNGVNLAQMCEYSFYLIFVDCTRSIEIARRLLTEERADRLILPQTSLTAEISEICYESLPNAIEFVAREKGIAVERARASKIDDQSKGEEAKSSHIWNKPHAYQRLLEIAAPFLRKNVILFHSVYAYQSLATETKKQGLRPLRVIPHRRADARTKAFMNDFRSKSAGYINKVMIDNNDSNGPSGAIFSIAHERLSEFFSRTVPTLVEYVEWADYYSRKMRPRVLVIMEDVTPINRCVSRVFRKGGAQIIILQHGLVTKDMAGFYLMPIEGNVQALWGRYFLDWHTKRGKDPGSLIITGSHSYENIQPKETSLAAVKEKFGLVAGRPILLVGTSRYSGISAAFTMEKEQRFFDNVFRGLSGTEDYQIVTKMHPSCGNAYFEMAERSAARNNVNSILTRDNLRELMNLSQVVVMATSTIGYEAVLLRKPLVCVDFEGPGDESVFVIANVAIGVEKATDLVQGIKAAIDLTQTKEYETSRRRFIEHHLDGEEASKKIAKLVDERQRMSETTKGKAGK